jgi:hypothetical protein
MVGVRACENSAPRRLAILHEHHITMRPSLIIKSRSVRCCLFDVCLIAAATIIIRRVVVRYATPRALCCNFIACAGGVPPKFIGSTRTLPLRKNCEKILECEMGERISVRGERAVGVPFDRERRVGSCRCLETVQCPIHGTHAAFPPPQPTRA